MAPLPSTVHIASLVIKISNYIHREFNDISGSTFKTSILIISAYHLLTPWWERNPIGDVVFFLYFVSKSYYAGKFAHIQNQTNYM